MLNFGGRGNVMSYNYEALDDERFQKFAHVLIATIYPAAQCLPVGQPDGGRDAFFWHQTSRKKELVVFQVKFSRHPASRGEREAISQLIKTEGDKVAKLIELGATSYVLITNISGTSHLGAGSIDVTNEALSSTFGIPAQVWWRDDLVH